MRRARKLTEEMQQIDWVKAAILERKMAKKLEYADIAAKAKCDSDYLRKLMTTKRTENWDAVTRKAVCDALGIKVRTLLSVTHDDEVELY